MGSSALQTARRAFVKVLLVLAVVYGLTLNITRDGNCARSSRLVGQLIFARKGGCGTLLMMCASKNSTPTMHAGTLHADESFGQHAKIKQNPIPPYPIFGHRAPRGVNSQVSRLTQI